MRGAAADGAAGIFPGAVLMDLRASVNARFLFTVTTLPLAVLYY